MSPHSTALPIHSTPAWDYQQIVFHICSIWTNLRDSLYYMRQVAMHAMDYTDAAITGTLLHHVCPVEDLQKILTHIEDAYLQPCTYQFHQRTHSTSTDTCIPLF